MYAFRQWRATLIWRGIAAWAIVVYLYKKVVERWRGKTESRLD